MASTSSAALLTPEACSPAPYGRACVGCSRAKCKCFYRAGGTECERCHRLGMLCEPSERVRKRKANTPPPLQPPPNARLEAKIDDLVSILRSQASANQSYPTPRLPEQQTTPNATHTPSGSSTTSSSALTGSSLPDVVVDTGQDYVNILRPAHPRLDEPLPPVLADVSARFHQITDATQDKQLDWFRHEFLAVFPFVHAPLSMSAAELRSSKPFLWLVIMCLTTKVADQQFSLEEVVWAVITRRIVAEHLADLDLLQGMICFGSWSHYFKKEKPFMTMISQLCTSLASELGLHRDAPADSQWRSRAGESPLLHPDGRPKRTLEERRTMLAVYHLSSATWSGYRKTEPMRWSPYMTECLRILTEGQETQFDVLLTAEVKCQLIANQVLSLSSTDTGQDDHTGSAAPSQMLISALLTQLDDLHQVLPLYMRQSRTAQLYILSTRLTIHASLLGSRPFASHTRRPMTTDPTNLAHTRHLQSLETTLRTAERMVSLFFDAPPRSIPIWWPAMSVDVFTQLTHCMVVILKLTMLRNEPGWNAEEAKRRVDVFALLDRAAAISDGTPAALGIMDATHGDRHGLFFKTGHLFRAIKLLFFKEMHEEQSRSAHMETRGGYGDGFGGRHVRGEGANINAAGGGRVVTVENSEGGMQLLDDDFLEALGNEPWMADLLGPSWGYWGSDFSM